MEFILNKSNKYHPNINFSFELKKNNETNFLGVAIKRLNNNKSETSVYQKLANTYIHINWNAYPSTEWKIVTLTNLIKQEKLICSDKRLVNAEMEYLTKVFHKVNDCAISIINKIAQQELTGRVTYLFSYAVLHNDANKMTPPPLPSHPHSLPNASFAEFYQDR